jgi:hypothetical protein
MKIIIDGVTIETSSVDEATRLIKSLKSDKPKNNAKKVHRRKKAHNEWTRSEIEFLKNNLNVSSKKLHLNELRRHSEMSISTAKTKLRTGNYASSLFLDIITTK